MEANYYQVLEDINKIFLPISQVDYRKVNKNEIKQKVESFLRKYKLKDATIQIILENVGLKLDEIANHKSNHILLGQKEDQIGKNYDQMNYYIMDEYLNIKQYLFEKVQDAIYKDLRGSDRRLLCDVIGSSAEYLKYASIDNMKNYIREVLDVSIEEGDNIYYSNYARYIANYIVEHFSFSGVMVPSEINSELRPYESECDNIEVLLKDLFYKSYQPYGERVYVAVGLDPDKGSWLRKSKVDMQIYKSNLEKIMDLICNELIRIRQSVVNEIEKSERIKRSKSKFDLIEKEASGTTYASKNDATKNTENFELEKENERLRAENQELKIKLQYLESLIKFVPQQISDTHVQNI